MLFTPTVGISAIIQRKETLRSVAELIRTTEFIGHSLNSGQANGEQQNDDTNALNIHDRLN